MGLVPFIENVTHHFRWWSVHNRRRNYVGHVSMVLILTDVQLGVRIKLTDGCQMNISPVFALATIA